MKNLMYFGVIGVGLSLCSCNCVFATRSVVYQLMQDAEKGATNNDNMRCGETNIAADQSDSGKLDLTK